MWRSFLKLAFRVLLRNWRFSLLNLAGLTVGLASFTIIMSWVKHELSYDRFHQKRNRIVQLSIKHPQGTLDPNVPYALAMKLANQYPEVESHSTLMRIESVMNCSFQFSPDSLDPVTAYEPSVVKVDTAFFRIFDLPLLHGSRDALLDRPEKVVISSRIADRYFHGLDPVNRTILINNTQLLTISGVVQVPENTFFHFDFFLPVFENLSDDWNWRDPSYLLLAPGVDLENFNQKIASSLNEYYPVPLPDTFQVSAVPIHKTHLYFSGKGKLWLFSGVGLLLLLVACLNYMNLATANYTSRMRETGMRKVLGARKKQIYIHYFLETFILALGALILALFAAELMLPVMEPLFGKRLEIGYLEQPALLVGLIIIAGIMGSLATLYPALLFAVGNPAEVLHRTVLPEGRRSVLILITIIFQFTLCIALLISTLAVMKQTRYVTEADLGLSVENVISIPMNQGLGTHFLGFLERLESNPDIEMVTAGQSFPYNEDYKTNIQWPAMEDPAGGLCRYSICLGNFIEVFDMELIEGRGYSELFGADMDKYIINERAAEMMGYNEPVGQSLTMWGRTGEIIGVVKDFHHVSLHREILPHVFNIHPSNFGALKFVFVKLKTGKRTETLGFLEAVCQDFAPDFPFSYSFLEDDLRKLYTVDLNLGRIMGLFAILALVLSSLGIYGLAYYSVEKSSRSIAMRKVMGAETRHILSLFYKNMLSRIGVSLVLAIGLSLFAISRWLRDFAFHISVDPLLVIVPALLALLIAGLATLLAIWRTVRKNPAEIIKQE